MPESIGRPQNDDRPGRLAFQGAYGAFSHEACLALRPWDEPIPFDTFEEVIEAVMSGDCDGALIPVENSSIGAVEPAATLVAATGLTPPMQISRTPVRPLQARTRRARAPVRKSATPEGSNP